ncbi:MAG: TfoX/Sxy family protein [Deltaproteobacteria bacterium]
MPKPRVDPFLEHVHDLLAPLGDIRVRAMFGAHGVWAGDLMFGIISDGALYLKVDALNEPRFVEAALGPFVYQSSRGETALGYRRAPDEGLDDGEVLRDWAEGAIGAAVRRRKVPKKKKAAEKTVKKAAKRSPSKLAEKT